MWPLRAPPSKLLFRMNLRHAITAGCLIAALLGVGRCHLAVAADETAVQKAADKITADAVSPEVIKDLMSQVEKSADLDKDAKDKILGLYRQSLQDLEMVEVWEARTAEYAEIAQTADAETVAAKERLAALPKTPKLDLHEEASLTAEEELLEHYQRQLSAATAALAKAEAEPRRRTIRRLEIQRLLKTARDRFEEYRRQPNRAIAKTGVEPLELARRIRVRAGRLVAERMIAAYEKELAAYDATAALLPLRVDIATREVQLAKDAVKLLKARVSSARREEAEQQIRSARLEAAMAHPAVEDIAKTNETLAKDRRDLMNRVEKESKALSRVEETSKSLGKEIASVKDRIDSIGHTGAVGLLLRNQRAALPDMYEHERAVRLRRSEIPRVQMQLFNLAESRAKLADVEGQTQAVLNGLPAEALEADGELTSVVRELLQTQKRYIDLLTQEYNKYFKILVELDNRERELIATSEEYQDYIDEHVLWIASTSELWNFEEWHLSLAATWLVSPQAWTGVLRSLGRDVAASPVTWFAAVLGFVLLAYLRRRWRRSIVRLGERAAASGVRAFAPTARAAVLTIAIAMVPFAIPLFLAWRVSAHPESSEFARILAGGLRAIVLIYFPFELFRQACREGGLAEKHFGWPLTAVRRLALYARRLTFVTMPLVFVAVIANARQDARWQDTLGRICFTVALGVVACGMHRLIRRDGELYRGVLAAYPDGRFSRVFRLWYLLGVVIPLGLALLAILGYYYTAWQFASRWIETLFLLAGLFLLGAFFLRWVLIVRRRLAIERARRQQPTAAGAMEIDERGSDTDEPETPVPFEPEVDLAKINAQARRIVYAVVFAAGLFGLWWIWVDVFPALGILKKMELWDTAVETTQVERTVDGETTVSTIPTYRKVTMADIAWAVLIVLITFFGARNVPGLLEIFFLEFLPLDKGVRYAICALFRYVLVAVGVVWCAAFVGITWTKVQWILAAMSVGLGFGLQEVFANFVSGLILLFERPIRVGDVITIGGATGKVTSIQIRATTIEDWDRKELVVPNKEFTTGRLLNWTLTNNVNRLVLEVGVAYNSDPDRVREILLKLAAEHPKVLDNPKPIAIFQEFGPSALHFSLRIYLPSMTGRLNVKHQINAAIHRELRAAGIEIAYPQLDLHLKKATGGSDTRPPSSPMEEPPVLPDEDGFGTQTVQGPEFPPTCTGPANPALP